MCEGNLEAPRDENGAVCECYECKQTLSYLDN